MTRSLFPRPAPWAPEPEGFHFEAYEPASWELIQPHSQGRICRARDCRNEAVATLYRTAFYASGQRQMPWHYCAEHMYGAWIEDGKVLRWRLVKDFDNGN